MQFLLSLVKRSPLVTFFCLAYALTWSMIALVSVSLVFPILGLFGPALAAFAVVAICEGRDGVRALLRRLTLWRVGLRWYGVALGLPIVLGLAVFGLHTLRGASIELEPGGALLMVVLAILVVGEEVGWRGYALPRLQARFNGLVASLLLGGIWAAWHLMNVRIPGLDHYGRAFPAFLLFVVAQTIIFTWLANHTRGSILLAWLFHAAINVAGATFFVGDHARQWWLSGALYGVVALIVVLATGPNLARKGTARLDVGGEAVAL